ncbi:MAG: VOC family protein [Halobacteriota archaeon]
MLSELSHLALEVVNLGRARRFYVERLGLVPERETETELAFDIGAGALVLRRPSSVPRGGLHTHYAFSVPESEYARWADRLADLDPAEFDFGSYRSLYVDDPDGHCVEVGNNADGGTGNANGRTGLVGIFEVVLEVASLDEAERLYRRLGFTPVDRGSNRRRVRLRGPFDLELWEPQLGIADARGGVHVDIGFETPDPAAAVEAIEPWIDAPVRVDGGFRAREQDCHYLTFVTE